MVKFIIFCVIAAGSTILCVFLFVKIMGKAGDDLATSYMKPDTSITIHNGIPDTVITKKSKPFWLK